MTDQSDSPFDPAAEAVDGIGPYVDVGGNRWATWKAYETLREHVRQEAERIQHHWCHPSSQKPNHCDCGATQQQLRLYALIGENPS